uniref:centlein isoform X2 n=1 Tax=Myxine glutinosa TaxID=7769 RepID=UPI00358E2D66
MASWEGCDETAEERARRLAEELRQCQADKDFVWSLWKRLQEDEPDVSQVVSMVVEREKQRAEEKASKVLEILQVKDHKIRELERQSSAQQRELDDLERRRATVEESISLREQLSALSTHWEESTSKAQITTRELSRKLDTITEQRRALEAKDKQLAELQSRVARWERDAAIEHQLSQEQRERRMDAQQRDDGAHQSAMSKLEERVKELVEEKAHQKTKLENVQQHLAVTTREKVLLETGLRELRVQLQTKEQQVHALERGMQQAERTAGESQAAALTELHTLAGQSEHTLHARQVQLEHAQACVAEFKSIVRVLASELQQQVNEVRAALLQREQHDANVSVAVSQAKIVAASILNLSQSELSEIMDANQMDETCEDKIWMQQLDIILDSQPPFAIALQQHLQEKRQERARLASQLQDATTQRNHQLAMWTDLGFHL